MDDGSWRKSFVSDSLERARAEKLVAMRQRREQLMAEIGGAVTYEGILKAAVKRARDASQRSGGNSYLLYGTWHQHVGTIQAVWDKFEEILNEPLLEISSSQKVLLRNQLNQNHGTGASLYFE